MAKYSVALGLIAVMGIAISIIDAQSTDVTEPTRTADDRPSATGTIYATGIVEGATEDIHLRSEQFGRVQEVLVTAGKWVEADDVLIRLDGDRQRQELVLASAKLELSKAELERLKNGASADERDEAHAQVRAARARLDQATRNLARIEQLRNQRAVTQQEADDHQALVDTSRAELEAAEARLSQIEAPARVDELRAADARVAAAQAEISLAEIGLSKTELRAPRRACVLDVNTEPGELTGPDAPRPVVDLSDTSTVRVRAFVEELDAPRVRIGMPARVTADGLSKVSFTGYVVSISPRMTNKSLHADRPNELYDMKVREVLLELSKVQDPIIGLRVDVELSAQQSHSALLLNSGGHEAAGIE